MVVTVKLEGNGNFGIVFSASAPFASGFPAEKGFVHFNAAAETVETLAFAHGARILCRSAQAVFKVIPIYLARAISEMPSLLVAAK